MGKWVILEGMSGCFGAVMGASRALDVENTPPMWGLVTMMKKNVAGVGICGYMTSFKQFETWLGKWIILEGMSGCFGAVVGAPRASWCGKHPSQVVIMMETIVAGVGICGCVTSLKPFENMVGKIVNMGGMSGCFGALMGAPRALNGEITPPWCGWGSMMKKNVAGVGCRTCRSQDVTLKMDKDLV